ncbi:hypothetical protein H0H93_012308 [Arthromyces matolae]|nr:hypothetical protein H0H93_012308 [Arthromyces matolae]
MPNPGVFLGPRKEFLLGTLEEYKVGVSAGHSAETLAAITRRFFKRWSPDLPLEEEISPEALASVDDYAADPERPPLPDIDAVGQDAYNKAVEAESVYQQLLKKRKDQIRNFLSYRLAKLAASKAGGVSDPYAAVKRKFLGISANKPRKLAAHNIWRRSNAEQVEAEVRRRSNGAKIIKKEVLTKYDQATMALFKIISEDEQAQFKALAEQEHSEDLEKWKEDQKLIISTDPAARQCAIEHVPTFIQPILDVLQEVTGWRWHLMGGGPEPADGGRLNVMSVASSGTTSGPVGLSFIQSQRDQYRRFVLPVWGNFLRMCYSPDECRARALPESGLTLAELGLDEGSVILDTIEGLAPYPSKTAPLTSQPSALPSQPPSPVSLHQPSPPPSRAPSPVSYSRAASRQPSSPPSRAPSPPASTSAQASAPHSQAPSRQSSAPPSPSLQASAPPSRAPSRQPSAPPSHAPSPSPQASASPSYTQSPSSSHEPSAPAPASTASSPSTMTPDDSPPTRPSQSTRQGIRAMKRRRLDLASEARKRQRPSRSPPVTAPIPTPLTSPPVTAPIPTPSTATPVTAPIIPTPSTAPPVTAPIPTPSTAASVTAPIIPTPSTATPVPPPVPTPSTLPPVSVSSRAPKWFINSMDMLQSLNCGVYWIRLLHVWNTFEEKSLYAKSPPLPASHRPVCVTDWIQRARSPTYRPEINIAKIQEDFDAWFDAIHDDIRRSGQNGFVSVLAALFFWRYALSKSTESDQEWEMRVKSVSNSFMSA